MSQVSILKADAATRRELRREYGWSLADLECELDHAEPCCPFCAAPTDEPHCPTCIKYGRR